MWTKTQNFLHWIEGEVPCLTDGVFLVGCKSQDTLIGHVKHLMIVRCDGEQIKSWECLQRIKNEVLGYEVEAMEIFPKNSQLVNNSNMRHLWCLAFDLPFGYKFRATTKEEVLSQPCGIR